MCDQQPTPLAQQPPLQLHGAVMGPQQTAPAPGTQQPLFAPELSDEPVLRRGAPRIIPSAHQPSSAFPSSQPPAAIASAAAAPIPAAMAAAAATAAAAAEAAAAAAQPPPDSVLLDFCILLQQTQQSLQGMMVDLETACLELDLSNARAAEAEAGGVALAVQLAGAQAGERAAREQLEQAAAR